MIVVVTVTKQVYKTCSNARRKRASISVHPVPSSNVTCSAAAVHTNSVDSDLLPPSTYDIPSPTSVGPISSTDSISVADSPSTTASLSDSNSITFTASSKPYAMADAPTAYPTLPSAGLSGANSTNTTPPPPTSDSTTDKENNILKFVGMTKEDYDVSKNEFLSNYGLTCISIGTAYNWMLVLGFK